MKSQIEKPFYTALEIANMLGVSKAALHYALGANKIPFPMRVGGAFLWNKEQTEKICETFEKRKQESEK